MSKLETIIFDVDGTLVDTSEFIAQAYEFTLSHHKLPPKTREEIASQVGKKLEDCYAFLAPDAQHDLLIETHRSFQANNLHLIRPFEYSSALMAKLKSNGKELALYSSRKAIVPSLEMAGIDVSIFSAIVDGSMVEKGKPDPEGIYLVLEKLGKTAATAAIVGDAGVDILAGKAAGLALTVGITHGFGTLQEITDAKPDSIIDSLRTLEQTLNDFEA